MLLQFIQEMLTFIGGLIVVYFVYVFFTRNDDKPATDTPTMAHTALRELVERAVDEARKLPALGATVSTGLQDDLSFSEQNYEDLLATAILNKVIEKFQNDRVDGNSNVLHRRPRSQLANDDNEMDLNDFEEGSSSLEPLSHDEHSGDENELRTRHMQVRQKPLSLTIEEQIEEVTTTYTSDEELRCPKTTVLDFRNARRVPFPEFGMDIIDPSQDSSEESQEDAEDFAHVDRITPVESWEENWLFQKRKIQTQSEPVAMLVPNPSSDFRALIGDKDAEDTSDLSEFSAQSDDEAEDDKLAEAINGVIPKNSNFFGDIGEAKKGPDSFDSNGQVTEESTNKEARLEVDLNREPEIIRRINKENENQHNRSEIDEKLEKKSLKQSNNPFAFTNHVAKNPEIPKTPATSPIENLQSEKNSSSDVRQLNAEPSSTEMVINENGTKNGLSTISQGKSENEIEKKDNQELDNEKKRHSQSFAVNECFKANLRDVDDNDVAHEVKGLGRCNDEGKKVMESPVKEESKANGNAVEIKSEEVMANDITSQGTDRKCQALAQAKAESAKEKPVSEIDANENIGLATPPRPGTIAEREHKKWENAAPIENNPYSEENIQKRLLERQYARRSSDVSGSSSTLQTCPSPPLQIVLGASRPDFRRFGRDYYINEAKFPKGHSIEESGFFTATSRPNSSLSHRSLSTGSDYEQQERSRSVDTESTCSTSSEPKTKLSSELQQNNVQVVFRRGSMPVGKNYEITEIQTRDSRNGKNWNGQNCFDEILESERKNSKNEINAKLNNRENFDNTEKPIRRIDLSAYGFENEFNEKNGQRSVESKRVVNKLDLRSFGYDSGLRRTQSNNNIDRRLNSKYSGRNFVGKSNNGLNNANPSLASLEGSDDEILTKSSENLIKDTSIDCQKFGRITSAKSVPNIGDLYSRINDSDRAGEVRKKSIDGGKSTSINADECNGFQGSYQSKNNINNTDEVKKEQKSYVEKKLPMPSVRILAQAFNKSAPINSESTRRPSKSVNVLPKERPTTPEIHIVDTPRQMHSLTARSISREFREGLRQMSNKQVPLSKANGIPEQIRPSDAQSTPNPIETSEEVSVIAPGKLKNNIQFWEQLNRKS